MLRDGLEFKQLELQGSVPEPYWDPVHRGMRRERLQLMRSILRSGLVRALLAGRGKERASPFFVAKPKSDKIRIIVDARRSNLRFRSPPGVTLCTAEGLRRIEVDKPCCDAPESRLKDLAV